MAYTLINTETKTATEVIRCDAFQSYYDHNTYMRKNGRETSLKFNNDIVVIVRNKNGVIDAGKKYVYREFVDENGEVFVLNSGIEMDKVAIRNGLYSPIILKQLK